LSRDDRKPPAADLSHPPIAMLGLVAAMAIIGANVPFGKVITAEIPIAAFIVIRFATASLLLAPLTVMEPGPRLSQLTPVQWVAVLMQGLVGSVLFTFCMLEGVSRTSGVDAGIITAALPAVVAVLGMMLGERLRAREFAMIALAVAGIAVIQTGGAAGGASTLVGNVYVGLAVLCEAVAVISSRTIASAMGPIRLSLVVAMVSLAGCLPFAWGALAAVDWANVAGGTWGLFAWYIGGASVFGTILWYRAIPHVPPWRAGLATAALPLAAMVVSALFLGEAISVYQVAGAVLVIAAILAGTLLGSAPAHEPPHDRT
jgi:drug/metabolite transporter (DMT)-like permease